MPSHLQAVTAATSRDIVEEEKEEEVVSPPPPAEAMEVEAVNGGVEASGGGDNRGDPPVDAVQDVVEEPPPGLVTHICMQCDPPTISCSVHPGEFVLKYFSTPFYRVHQQEQAIPIGGGRTLTLRFNTYEAAPDDGGGNLPASGNVTCARTRDLTTNRRKKVKK